jgi:hypothetical protein
MKILISNFQQAHGKNTPSSRRAPPSRGNAMFHLRTSLPGARGEKLLRGTGEFKTLQMPNQDRKLIALQGFSIRRVDCQREVTLSLTLWEVLSFESYLSLLYVKQCNALKRFKRQYWNWMGNGKSFGRKKSGAHHI